MERSRNMTKALGLHGIWGTVVDLLAFSNTTDIHSREGLPECMGPVSPAMLNEVLGEWLWIHNPPVS